MEFTVSQIATLIGGTIEGNGEAIISSLCKIEEGIEQGLTFLANPVYTPYIYQTEATAAIVSRDFVPEKPIKTTLIRVEDPYVSFAVLLEKYNEIKRNKKGIEQPSFIAPTAKIGKDVYIGAFAYIGEGVTLGDQVKIYPHVYIGDGCKIGNQTTIFAGTRIYEGTVIGNECTLHAGVVIGADGFGFAPNESNVYKKIPQTGSVIIEDCVEIGANTCIDRATLGSTIIRKGVKLDNLIQIAHNVEIGENTVIAGQTGVAGSARVGQNCMIAAQVGIVGHISIANGVKIAGQSGIGQTISTENEVVQGSPAFPVSTYRRSYVLFRKLPELSARIEKLEKELLRKGDS